VEIGYDGCLVKYGGSPIHPPPLLTLLPSKINSFDTVRGVKRLVESRARLPTPTYLFPGQPL